MARVQLTGAIALQECSHQPAALRVIAGVANQQCDGLAKQQRGV
jgi:hypothetical protein